MSTRCSGIDLFVNEGGKLTSPHPFLPRTLVPYPTRLLCRGDSVRLVVTD